MAVPVKTCGKRSVKICLSEFLQERGWKQIPILGDGNCFFRSIAKYYEMSGEPHAPNHTQLRQQVADFIESKADNSDTNTLSVIAGLTNNVDGAIDKLRKDKVWNVEIFEMVPPYMARALGVHIDIYDSRSYKKPEKKLWKEVNGVKQYRMTEEQPTMIEVNHLVPDVPSATRINLLRVYEGHYDLLWPDNKLDNNNSKSNNNNNNNQEEANLKAAIKASKYTAKVEALKQQIHNAELAKQLKQLSIANKPSSKKKKPSVGVLPASKASLNASPNSYHSNSSVVSNASLASPVGSFNRITFENAQKELPLKKYLRYTKVQIYAFLNKHGIEYDSILKKEDLYGLFLMAFMEDSNLRIQNILQKNKQTAKQAKKIASRRASKKASKK